jgi:hypothetical protein
MGIMFMETNNALLESRPITSSRMVCTSTSASSPFFHPFEVGYQYVIPYNRIAVRGIQTQTVNTQSQFEREYLTAKPVTFNRNTARLEISFGNKHSFIYLPIVVLFYLV